MQIIVRSASLGRPLCLTLDGGDSRAPDNLFSVLCAESVTSLEIRDWKGDRLSKKISRLSELREISFVRCHALACVPAALRLLPRLESACFSDCADFSGLKGLEQCEHCRMARVSRCDGFEAIDADLSQMKNLVALDFSHLPNLGYVDLDKLPQQLAILDLHGSARASFDPGASLLRSLRSAQIQDYARLAAGEEFEPSADIASALRLALSSRSSAGYDD